MNILIDNDDGRDLSKKLSMPKVLQFLVFLNLYIYIYDGFFTVPNRKILGFIFSILLATVSFLILRDHIVWIDLIVPFLFFYILLYARCFTYRGYTSFLKNVPYPLIGFSMAVLIKYMRWPKWSFYLYTLFAFIPFFYGFFIVKMDMNNFEQYIQMNRNSIPILLFVTCSLLYMIEITSKKNWLSIVPVLCMVVFSFLSKSRTGLLISILLLFMVLGFDLVVFIGSSVQKKRKADKFIFIEFFLMVVILISIGVLVVFSVMNSRFISEGLQTSLRIQILQEFFSELTWKHVLFGFRPEVVNRLSRIDSTYIMALSYLGISSIIFYWSIGYLYITLFKHRRWMLLCLLSLQLIYGLAEFLSPLDIGDIILIPLMVLGFSTDDSGSWLHHVTPLSRKFISRK